MLLGQYVVPDSDHRYDSFGKAHVVAIGRCVDLLAMPRKVVASHLPIGRPVQFGCFATRRRRSEDFLAPGFA